MLLILLKAALVVLNDSPHYLERCVLCLHHCSKIKYSLPKSEAAVLV